MKPTVHFKLTGHCPRGGSIIILSGTTMSRGVREPSFCTSFATIRRLAANAAANGVVDICLEMSRHTQEHGWYYRAWWIKVYG